jgi:hypothetical protein
VGVGVVEIWRHGFGIVAAVVGGKIKDGGEFALGQVEPTLLDEEIALFEAVAKAPVVPLGDGTWCPTAPPPGNTALPPITQAPRARTSRA